VMLLHFADVHLGQTNFGHLDTATGLHSRILDYLDALDCVVEAAQKYQPDLIIFAGDAFRTRSPVPTLVTPFAERMIQLADVAPMVMVVGNHDRLKSGKGRAHSIDVMSHLGAKHDIIVESEIAGHLIGEAYVVTLPWFYDKDLTDVYDAINKVLGDSPDDNTPCILAAHVGVPGLRLNDGYVYREEPGNDLCVPSDLFNVFDYSALGHIHGRQCVVDNPPAVYCGSLERIDWGERGGSKGFVLADVNIDNTSWEFVDVPVRDMVDIQIEWDEIYALDEYDVEDAIVRVCVHTDGIIPRATVAETVRETINRNYYLLDRIDVLEPVVARSPRVAGIDNLDPLELLDIWFQEQHPNDEARVDELYFAAEELVDSVEKET